MLSHPHLFLLPLFAALTSSCGANWSQTVAFSTKTQPTTELSKETKSNRKRHQISFLGNATVLSDPVSISNFDNIGDFFKSRQNLEKLFPGSEGFREFEPTKEHRLLYNELCARNRDGDTLTNCDQDEYLRNEGRIVEMTSPGMDFPGLSVLALNTFWMNIYDEKSATTGKTTDHRYPLESRASSTITLPNYEFTLIKSTQSAKGSGALVWLFNKLVNGKKDVESGSDSGSTNFSVQRVSPQLVNSNDANSEVVFSNSVILEIKFSISNTLMKLMPFSHRSFQEKGSKSIQRLIDSNAKQGIQQFCDAFVKWSRE